METFKILIATKPRKNVLAIFESKLYYVLLPRAIVTKRSVLNTNFIYQGGQNYIHLYLLKMATSSLSRVSISDFYPRS